MTKTEPNHNPKLIHGWEPSSDPYDQTKIIELEQQIANQVYKHINGIIVIKDGKLLLESYFNGAHRDQPHDPRSVGKTFASAMTGIAIRDGYLTGVEQTLDQFYDLSDYEHFDGKKCSVSLEHLLTMSSGFDGFDFDPDSIGNEENMYPQENWVQWTLNLPMAHTRQPGDSWYYFTAGIVVLGDILHRVLPGGLEAYADATLFKPLGIHNYAWQHTPQGVANTAGGIRLTPLDFAKFGLLYKNKGRWGNQQIIPQDWVDQSLTCYYQTTSPEDQYGYLWWHKTYQSHGKGYEMYYCGGNGGNKIMVFTESNLVIVITASAYGQRYMHSQVDEMLTRYILPAI